MFKNKLNKHATLNLGGILSLMVTVYLICYLLWHKLGVPISIDCILSYLNHWVRHWHVLVVGLLPVYVALMVFGTAMAGSYLGSTLHRWVHNFFQK